MTEGSSEHESAAVLLAVRDLALAIDSVKDPIAQAHILEAMRAGIDCVDALSRSVRTEAEKPGAETEEA